MRNSDFIKVGFISVILVKFIEFFIQTKAFTDFSIYANGFQNIFFGIILAGTIGLIISYNFIKRNDAVIFVAPIYFVTKEIINYIVVYNITKLSLIMVILIIETLFIALPIGIATFYFYQKYWKKK